jgi:hypothetical protein
MTEPVQIRLIAISIIAARRSGVRTCLVRFFHLGLGYLVFDEGAG